MFVDTTKTNGTLVVGSSFDRLITTYRDRELIEYPHEIVGKLHYDDNWLMLKVNNDIARYYSHIIKQRFGIELMWRNKTGAHISIIRGERLHKNANMWGKDEGKKIKVAYTHDIFTNASHWWLNVKGDELSTIRSYYGLQSDKRFFHLTVGRI